MSLRAVLVPAIAVMAIAVTAGPARSDPPFPGPMRVHVDDHGRAYSPSTRHPGMTEIQNVGTRSMLVVRRSHAGPTRLLADLELDDGPILNGRLAGDFTLIDTLKPHADVFTTLQRGTYYLVSLDPNRLTKPDVAVTRVSGATQNNPTPAGANAVVVTRRNNLAVPYGTEEASAVYVLDEGTHSVQIRLYRLRSGASQRQVNAFVTEPSWSGLKRLPVAAEVNLAALASTRQVGEGDLPAYGRYVAIAVPLVAGAVHRPQLRPGLALYVHLHE